MSTLLEDIEAFLRSSGMTPTRLGDEALNDRHFVRQLRLGRRVWPETERKVRVFMSEAARTATCTVCDLRADDPQVRLCVASNCGLSERQAA